MAQPSRVADSDESEIDSVELLKPRNSRQPTPNPNRNPVSALAHQSGESVQDSIERNDNLDEDGDETAMDVEDKSEEQVEGAKEDADNTIVVMVPGPRNPEEYVPYQDDTVYSVLKEINGSDGETLYRVEYEDERQENLFPVSMEPSVFPVVGGSSKLRITFNRLSHLPNGNNALNEFRSREASESITVMIHQIPAGACLPELPKNAKKKRRLVNNMSTVEIEKARRSTRAGSRQSSRPIFDDDEEDEDDSESGPVLSNGHGSRKSGHEEEEDELAGDLQVESEGSEIAYAKPKRRRASSARASKPDKRGRPQAHGIKSDYSSKLPTELPSRISRRGNKTGKNMEEVDIDEEVYADEVAGKAAPKVISIREIYRPVSAKSSFALVHDQDCDVCGGTGKNSNKGRSELIYCQGCSSSIHRICLGYRSGREHMVTKVWRRTFRYAVSTLYRSVRQKDPLAPQLGACSSCNEPGASCAAFSVKKTAKQEEKLREENNGDDPITMFAKILSTIQKMFYSDAEGASVDSTLSIYHHVLRNRSFQRKRKRRASKEYKNTLRIGSARSAIGLLQKCKL
ncbi:uncharacterized protein EAF02_006117 [Botrytis sinoallii]|uniref:uncharacterized protein n=1 Tax=Botrytis sinoallii TaxID=1463999 RepID=UPI001900410A|nr:uncharacterized protein EAF02_006117 [Botrytis sinoallii]KAF7882754.1 hypothetical protein EAF02_006117 [Botrytis sinoallii]